MISVESVIIIVCIAVVESLIIGIFAGWSLYKRHKDGKDKYRKREDWEDWEMHEIKPKEKKQGRSVL